MANFSLIDPYRLCMQNFYFKVLITFQKGKYYPVTAILAKRRRSQMRRIVLVLLLLFVLALVSQAAHAAVASSAAPRWD